MFLFSLKNTKIYNYLYLHRLRKEGFLSREKISDCFCFLKNVNNDYIFNTIFESTLQIVFVYKAGAVTYLFLN